MTRRAPSGYPLCAAPGCPYLGTNRGRCVPHWKAHRDPVQPELELENVNQMSHASGQAGGAAAVAARCENREPPHGDGMNAGIVTAHGKNRSGQNLAVSQDYAGLTTEHGGRGPVAAPPAATRLIVHSSGAPDRRTVTDTGQPRRGGRR